MLIRAGYEIRLESSVATPMLAMLSIHPSRNKDLRTPHRITGTPDVPMYDYLDAFGNVCTRLTLPPGGGTLHADFVIEDSGLPDAPAPYGPQTPIEELPNDVLIFLLGSRYCETDKMLGIAWSLFGHIKDGRELVEAIVAYAHNRITFGYHHARPDKTAFDGYNEQTGVCRDYAHLAITLCRCMNIPTRYCTGYLGDIGVPANPPGDFSAWMEVYLRGAWYTFDARHNKPRIGRILMAHGRDATDTALTTAFGPTFLAKFDIVTDEVDTI